MDELNDIFESLAAAAAGAVPGLVTAGSPDAGAPVTVTPQASTASALSSIAQTIANPQAGLGGSLLGTVVQAATAPQSGGVGSTLEHVAEDVLKSGFGLVPILGSLFGLFGGGSDSEALPAFAKYSMPDSIDYQAAETGGQIANVDYDQSGAPRAFGGGTGAAPAAAVTINVQAMDARSFLDRSNDIAAAVKEAMLNLNSINDVVSEL